MRRFFLSAFALTVSLPVFADSPDTGNSGGAVIREMNLARQNPALYATYAGELRSRYNGKCLTLPGGTRMYTKEGLHAVDEAIQFLRTTSARQALILSPGMCKSAADHCSDQADGGFSHTGRDGSNPGSRMSRYGTLSLGWGENIAYGKSSARDVVLALIIDDGQRARKHRKNIFNPSFNYAGAAFGAHARFRTVCSIDFAGGYAERGQGDALVARNF
jgi:uncharacterized protein YkwD